METYHVTDFPEYEKVFRKHSTAVIELMRILEEKIKADLEIQSYRPKDLFVMVERMMYHANGIYEKENNIEDSFKIGTTLFVDSDETWSRLRTILKEEIAHYFDGKSKE